MKTKAEIIDDCFSMLLRTGVTIGASPDDDALALRRLEDIMAELESRGLATGYNFEENPDQSSLSGLQNWMCQAISSFLALRVWPDFSPEDVNPMLISSASAAMSNLSTRLAIINPVRYAGRAPIGSGNLPWFRYRKFYGSYGSGEN